MAKKRAVLLRLDLAFLRELDRYCKVRQLSREGVIRAALAKVIRRVPRIRGQKMYTH